MHTRPHSIVLLISTLLIAVVLTATMSGAIFARSTFQSAPALPQSTPTGLLPGAPLTVTSSPTASPTVDILGATVTPPVPVATQPPVVPAEPSGFLPAPTLTNPDALLPLPSVAQPPLAGPAVATSEPAPEPTAEGSEAPGVAQLIDDGIVALSYLWLCCGALLVGLLALAVVWLARRRARR